MGGEILHEKQRTPSWRSARLGVGVVSDEDR